MLIKKGKSLQFKGLENGSDLGMLSYRVQRSKMIRSERVFWFYEMPHDPLTWSRRAGLTNSIECCRWYLRDPGQILICCPKIVDSHSVFCGSHHKSEEEISSPNHDPCLTAIAGPVWWHLLSPFQVCGDFLRNAGYQRRNRRIVFLKRLIAMSVESRLTRTWSSRIVTAKDKLRVHTYLRS